MKIALLSDVHDRTTPLLTALATADSMGCRHLLYLGDIVETGTFRLMTEEWPYTMDVVFGNNEIERSAFLRLAQSLPRVRHHGDEGSLILNNKRIFITHYPWIAERAAQSGKYDAVFFGHTHVAEQLHYYNTVIANPGEVGGVRRPSQFAIYDTQDGSLSFVKI